MPIVFRHDAAAVTPPSNTATRKYGQQLVLQERQQKYQGQQAAYDRMFDAYRQNTQNQFQLARDRQQDLAQATREGQQNADRAIREAQQQALQQAMQEEERQRRFLEEGRMLSGRFIMNAIESGEYDPATARELQQSLVDEAEALGNPRLDATQRAEALQAIRARRTVLSANRLPKAPPPTVTEEFQNSIAVDPETGMRYRKNGKGDFEPMEEPKLAPQNAQEYYSQNEDKFQKDLKATMDEMQAEADLDEKQGPVTQEAAWERMQKNYEFRQKALGRPQLGQPTPAPAMPGGAQKMPGAQKSILETAEPTEDGAAFLDWAAKQPNSLQSRLNAQANQRTALPPDAGDPPAPSANAWEEFATGKSQASAAPQVAPAPPAQVDFTALASAAKSDADRSFYAQMETVYKGQPSDVQSAIGVLLNPNAANVDAARAYDYLQGKGIDLNKLAEEASKTTKDKTRDKMRKQYGESYDSF